ncbi:unnamed protein product [Didymodactylos carnosus]|uniref:ADP ribosyltransferase domain-containing protein n=1 Tax=Didymodactylos carnosus TaxID=1234261 RepID=A0A8S2F1I9_9BILA|nr:unnamed protein product [Didymodactylos carnosus]CAF4163661.1 unnamed protein product [Didymodactylos carnosus]
MNELREKVKLLLLKPEDHLRDQFGIIDDWVVHSYAAVHSFAELKRKELIQANNIQFQRFKDKINDLQTQLLLSNNNNSATRLEESYQDLKRQLTLEIETKPIGIDPNCCLIRVAEEDTQTDGFTLKELQQTQPSESSEMPEEDDEYEYEVTKSKSAAREEEEVNSSAEIGQQRYHSLNPLLHDLSEDVKKYLKEENILSVSNADGLVAGDLLDTDWFKFLIILCYLPLPATNFCLSRLITTLRDYYEGNQFTLERLNVLERSYTSSNAVYWYTCDSPRLYQLLNKALCQRNIEFILLFTFFLKDLFVQLKDLNKKFKFEMVHDKKTHVITVYRGQFISRVEVRKLQKNTSRFFTNSFFSTTMNRQLALILLNPSLQRSDDKQSVLFEIKIDLTLKSSQPYADISSFSQFPSETEVLFSYGTEFQVIDVEYSQMEHIWIIKLSFVEGGSQYIWNTLELDSHSYIDEEDNEGDETKILPYMGSSRKMLKQSVSRRSPATRPSALETDKIFSSFKYFFTSSERS